MSEVAPILKQIHDEHDVYPRYGYTDHTKITKIEIASHPNGNGYRITTYPGGSGFGFDGFAIDLSTQTGIFSDEIPSRVETSRDYGGLMVMSVDEVAGGAISGGVISMPAAREGLLLPGDRGFELLTELHNQIRSLKEPIRDAIEVAGVTINPTEFNYSEYTGTSGPNQEKTARVHYRSSTYDVKDGNTHVQVELDATIETPFNEEPNPLVTYRSGLLTQEGRSHELSMDALVAFSGLHRAMGKLYR